MRRLLPTEGLVLTRTKEGSQVSRIVSGVARVVNRMLQRVDSECQRQRCTIKDADMTHKVAPSQDGVFNFGEFELVPQRRLLARNGKPLRIGSRALDLLLVLVENAGNVIAKDDLISRVWGNLIVEDTNLRVHISILRRVLGDDGVESRFIVHVARRGYIFVAPLELSSSDRITAPVPGMRAQGTLGASTAASGAHC